MERFFPDTKTIFLTLEIVRALNITSNKKTHNKAQQLKKTKFNKIE